MQFIFKISSYSEINSHINEDGCFDVELGFKVSQRCSVVHSIIHCSLIFLFVISVKSKEEAPWLKFVFCR